MNVWMFDFTFNQVWTFTITTLENPISIIFISSKVMAIQSFGTH